MTNEKIVIDPETNQSPLENLRDPQVDWVEEHTQTALSGLGEATEKTFYTKNTEENTVTYKINVVKEYLQKLIDTTGDNATTASEGWTNLVDLKNTAAWIMAVQIGLEYLGHDVGRIDGILSNANDTERSKTMAAIRDFQQKNSLNVDGLPGRETIKKLLEKLNELNTEVADSVDIPADGASVPADELIANAPEGAKIQYQEGSPELNNQTSSNTQIVVTINNSSSTHRVITMTVEIENGKAKLIKQGDDVEVDNEALEKSDKKEASFENVKPKDSLEVQDGQEIKPEDLLDLPEGAVTGWRGGEIDKNHKGNQEVVIMVTIGGHTKSYRLKVNIEDKTIYLIKVEPEEVKEDPYKDVKAKKDQNLPEEDVTADYLVETPEGVTVEFAENNSVNKDEDTQNVDIVLKKEGAEPKTITLKVTINENKISAEIQPEKVEEDPFENVTVNDKINLGNEESNKESNRRNTLKKVNNIQKLSSLKAKEFLNGLPDNATAEFINGDTHQETFSNNLITKNGDSREATILATIGEKSQEFKIKASFDKDYNIKLEEKDRWLRYLNIDELGSFDNNNKFTFKKTKYDGENNPFIEIGGEQFNEYKDNMDGLGYSYDEYGLFIGNYKNGKREGQGVMTWTNGEKYVGEWKNGYREGQGTNTWTNGNEYTGNFKDNKPSEGKFTLVKPEEEEYEVNRDKIGLIITTEGKYKNKYIDCNRGEILDVVITEEEFKTFCSQKELIIDDVRKIVNYARIKETDLSLDGLTSINNDVAKELGNHQGGFLSLNGLTSINNDVAKELGNHQGGLYLNGLTSINKDVAKELGNHQGGFLCLDGLTSINKDVAKELGNHQGDLSLDGLTSINKDVAKELGNHQGGDLYLNGLTSINKDIAEELGNNQGGFVSLDGLTSITNDVATELAKYAGGVAIKKDILTSEQKSILNIE